MSYSIKISDAYELQRSFQRAAPAAGGSQALLEGAAVCTCVAAGALTTEIALAGAAAGAATAAGQLTTEIPLAGAAQDAATAAADLTTEIRMAGAAQDAATAAGELTTEITLAGAAAGAAVAEAELTAPQPILLEGSALCSITAAGELTTEILLAGSAACSAIAAGDLTSEAAPDTALEGSAVCSITAEADLWTNPVAVPSQGGGGILWFGSSRPASPRQILLEGSSRCECFASGTLSDSSASALFEGSARISLSATGVLTEAAHAAPSAIIPADLSAEQGAPVPRIDVTVPAPGLDLRTEAGNVVAAETLAGISDEELVLMLMAAARKVYYEDLSMLEVWCSVSRPAVSPSNGPARTRTGYLLYRGHRCCQNVFGFFAIQGTSMLPERARLF